jgi:hypothetical protein
MLAVLRPEASKEMTTLRKRIAARSEMTTLRRHEVIDNTEQTTKKAPAFVVGNIECRPECFSRADQKRLPKGNFQISP